jgi:hypothetical protein
MTDMLKPRDAREVQDAIAWALSEDKALEIVGQGSKRALGRPCQTDMTLDLSGLTGVTLYWPKSRRCSPGTTSSSNSSRWITARCSVAKPGRGRSEASSPPTSRGRAASSRARHAIIFSA